MTPNDQGRDPIIFEGAIKLFNFYHWPTQVADLIYTDFTVSYRDALRDRQRAQFEHYLVLINFCENPKPASARKRVSNVKNSITI